MFHHKWLDIFPCALQQGLIAYPLQTQWSASLKPRLPVHPAPSPSPLTTTSLLSKSNCSWEGATEWWCWWGLADGSGISGLARIRLQTNLTRFISKTGNLAGIRERSTCMVISWSWLKEALTDPCPRLSADDLGVGWGVVYEKKSQEIYDQFKRSETYVLLLNKLNRNFLGRRTSSKSNNPVGSSAPWTWPAFPLNPLV